MKWCDCQTYIEITPPEHFNFHECLLFLNRSDQEIVHVIHEEGVYKLLKINDSIILCRIVYNDQVLAVHFPIEVPSTEEKREVVRFICEWFDLDRNVELFYQAAEQDQLLSRLTLTYRGLRMIGIPNLFEALTWAIIGQQINLTFAYKLKRRFIEKYGEYITFKGKTFWLFPQPEKIAILTVKELRALQFSTRKAEYVIGVARLIRDGYVTKDDLQGKDYDTIKQALVAIRGIGNWTADYVLMKCFRRANALPIADVGLHNALKIQLGLDKKPSIKEIEVIATNWEGWQAYATFYLWRSLYDEPV